jgi:hypothetical protein
MISKAECRMQNAAGARLPVCAISAFCFLPSAFCSAFLMAAAAGCNERSPAATPTASNLMPDQSVGSSQLAPKSQQRPTRDVTFDTIKFDMQKEEPFKRAMITPAIERLENSKIRIRGYILPSFQQSGLTQFVLVRDNMQCCFGPGAALFDCIVVEMDSGQTTDFTTQPVAVEGVFSINELRNPEGKCLAIYHLQAQKVQ